MRPTPQKPGSTTVVPASTTVAAFAGHGGHRPHLHHVGHFVTCPTAGSGGQVRVGLIARGGLRTSTPEQLGQMWSIWSAHTTQSVHSKLQITAWDRDLRPPVRA